MWTKFLERWRERARQKRADRERRRIEDKRRSIHEGAQALAGVPREELLRRLAEHPYVTPGLADDPEWRRTMAAIEAEEVVGWAAASLLLNTAAAYEWGIRKGRPDLCDNDHSLSVLVLAANPEPPGEVSAVAWGGAEPDREPE